MRAARRLLFRVVQLDDWQVILEIVECFFADGTISNLAANREITFGMANLKDIIIGRDMPHALSRVIPQTMMNSMTTGEGVEVAIKSLTAVNMRWTAPIVMASNNMPDYVNTGGALARRLATVRFTNLVTKVNTKLTADIKAREIPAILCRILRDYRTVRARVDAGGHGFWAAAPPTMLEWQGMLSAATNKLHEFLAMDEDERGCRIERVEGHVTHTVHFRAEFLRRMKETLDALDQNVLAQFGFRILEGKKENLCKGCGQMARGGGGKCCPRYSSANRGKRPVIYDMRMTAICAVEDAAGPSGAATDDED